VWNWKYRIKENNPIVQRVILRKPLLASPKSIEPFVTINTKEGETSAKGYLFPLKGGFSV